MTSERLTRSATLRWTTNPPSGVGRLGVASRAFAAVKISLAEGEPTPGETTPGEMLACTLAGYLGMHLAVRMQEAETPLRELVVDVELTISPWPEYTTEQIEFSVLGRLYAPGAIDEATFTGEIVQTLDTVADSLGLQKGLTRLADSQLR
jgi:hypothetical protein